MLVAYLVSSGAPVEIPDAVECIDCEDNAFVVFVDANGRELVKFRRADISMFATPDQAPDLLTPTM